MPSTLIDASDTTAAPTPRAPSIEATSLSVRCGWVVRTSLPFSPRMRATVIPASLVRRPSDGAASMGKGCARPRARSSVNQDEAERRVLRRNCDLRPPGATAASAQSGVDEQTLLGDHPAVVRGEEQRGARAFVGVQNVRQTLALHDLRDVGVAQPQATLT